MFFFIIYCFIYPGIAIYFVAPLWPYLVNTAVSLDSGPITLIDLVDRSSPNTGQGPETVQYQVVWHATGLANTQHNLLISVGAGQPYAVVDGLMYVLSPSPSSQARTIDYSALVIAVTLLRQTLAPQPLPPYYRRLPVPLYQFPSSLLQPQAQPHLLHPNPNP